MKKGNIILSIIIMLVLIIVVTAILVKYFSRSDIILQKQIEKFDTDLIIVQSEDQGVVCGPPSVVPDDVKQQFISFVKATTTADTTSSCFIAVPFPNKKIFTDGGFVIDIRTVGNARIISLADKKLQIVCQAYQVGKQTCIVEDSPQFTACLASTNPLFSNCNRPGLATDDLYWDGGESIVWRKNTKQEEPYTTSFYDVDWKVLGRSNVPGTVPTIFLFKSKDQSCFIDTTGKTLQLMPVIAQPGAICTNCAYTTCADFSKSEDDCVNKAKETCSLSCISLSPGGSFASCKSCDDVTSCSELSASQQQCESGCSGKLSCLATFNVDGSFASCKECSQASCNEYPAGPACIRDACSKKCFITPNEDGSFKSCDACSKIGSCTDYPSDDMCTYDPCKKSCYSDSVVSGSYSSCLTCPADCIGIAADQCLAVGTACHFSCKLSDDKSSCVAGS